MAGFVPVPIRRLTVEQAQKCSSITLKRRRGRYDKAITIQKPRVRIIPGGQQVYIHDGQRSFGGGTLVIALTTDD